MIFVAETSQQRRPAVGLTPLIDVVFILLIFFMLVVSFSPLQQVQLSTAVKQGQSTTTPEDRQMVRVVGAGQCEFLDVHVQCAGLPEALAEQAGRLVYLSYASEAVLTDIIAARDVLLTHGFTVLLAVPEVGNLP